MLGGGSATPTRGRGRGRGTVARGRVRESGSTIPAQGRGRGAGRRRPDGHAQAPRRPTPSGARRREGAQTADAKRGPPRGREASSRPAAHAIPPHALPRRAGRHAKLAKNDDLTTSDRRKTAAFLCEHGDHRARPGEMKRRWRRCEPTGCGFVVRSSFLASFSAIPAPTAATKPRTAPFPPVDAGPKAKTHPGRPCREDASRPGIASPAGRGPGTAPGVRRDAQRNQRRGPSPPARPAPARARPHPARPRHRCDAPAPRSPPHPARPDTGTTRPHPAPLPGRKGAPDRRARGALSLLAGRA